MKREAMIAHLVLNKWYPVRAGDGRKLVGLRNGDLKLAVGGIRGTLVRATQSEAYGRSQECTWDEVEDLRLYDLFCTVFYRL